MREQYIESAIRAIDLIGPQISMREIAAEAKIPKPTLYRFFTDKSELATAIGERIREKLHERLVAVPTRPGFTLGEFVRSSLRAHMDTVHEHPNVVRFLLISMSESTDTATMAFDRGRTTAADIASILGPIMTSLGGSAIDIDLDAYMIVGVVVSATDWWLRNATPDSSVEHFVDHVEKHVRAMIRATAEANGVEVDFDAPVDVSTTASAGIRI